MDFQRLLLFIIFSMSGIFLFQAWQKENTPQRPVATASAVASNNKSDVPSAPIDATTQNASPIASNSVPPSSGPITTPAIGKIITLNTDLLTVKVNTLGGVLEEVALKQHRDSADKNKPYYVFFKNAERIHVAQSGLIGPGLPNHNTVYTQLSTETELNQNGTLQLRLSAPIETGGEVKLTYLFKRDSYIIDVAYEVTNESAATINPGAYFHLRRDTKQTGASHGMMSIFYGPAVYTDQSKYKKIDFKDIDKGKNDLYPADNDSGWIGTVEHYFVNAWLPKDGLKREFYTVKEETGNIYRIGLKSKMGEIVPSGTAKIEMPIYVGPQEQDRLVAAATGLELVVDYGIFKFIAAPMFVLLKWFYTLVGNWGWAIVLLTILVKAAFYPLNAAAGRSMGKMKLVAPKLKELQTAYANDRVKLNQTMMELYKKEKINPLGGCLPILIQIPVFIALYWVLIAAVELRHAPWIGWIYDLSAPDPFFVLPVLYAITAFLQTRFQPPAPGMDPIQQKVLQYMPVAFAVMFVFFPAGLVLYWTVSNILQIAQQWRINSVLAREQALAIENRR